jgi:hypothetical protein
LIGNPGIVGRSLTSRANLEKGNGADRRRRALRRRKLLCDTR